MTFDILPTISTCFTLSILVVILIFGLYTIFLLIYSRKKDAQTPSEKYTPLVSIVLPTYNEGEFIQKKLENLLNTNYNKSKIEIIIVDDSNDKLTRELISSYAKKKSNIHINQSKTRRGYSKALLDGFKIANGEVIIITDCGSFFNLDTIPELVHPLNNSKIGGVTGSAYILNQNESAGKSESLYRTIYNFMRKSESNADSTFHFHGEVSSVKKELLKNLPNFDNLDIEIAFHIRKQGFRVFHNPEAKFFEYAPRKFKERYKQKLTRATGVIKVILGNKGMFSVQYGLFGVIIYPAHFLMMVICPIFIAISGFLYSLFLLFSLPNNAWPLIISALSIIVSLLIKKELIINFLQFEFVLLQAIWRALTDKSPVTLIEKIDSTRR